MIFWTNSTALAEILLKLFFWRKFEIKGNYSVKKSRIIVMELIIIHRYLYTKYKLFGFFLDYRPSSRSLERIWKTPRAWHARGHYMPKPFVKSPTRLGGLLKIPEEENPNNMQFFLGTSCAPRIHCNYNQRLSTRSFHNFLTIHFHSM